VAVLELDDLHVRYGGIQAVRGVSLSVDPGEVLVVLGANGAGKTSSLRAVAGLVPSTGSIRWEGRDLGRYAPHRRARAGLVLVPEGRRVFAPLTVEENLLLGAYRCSREQRRTGLAAAYEMFPRLLERRASPSGLLSGGEQQMLAIGRALMSGPRVVLMDEPSMGLAPAIVEDVMDAVARIAGQGVAVLMVEQNAVAALEVAHRAVVMERGVVALQGDAAAIARDPSVLKAFLGQEATAVLADDVRPGPGSDS
jgi:branched-chain amino acid transport system ATP-binding protein